MFDSALKEKNSGLFVQDLLLRRVLQVGRQVGKRNSEKRTGKNLIRLDACQPYRLARQPDKKKIDIDRPGGVSVDFPAAAEIRFNPANDVRFEIIRLDRRVKDDGCIQKVRLFAGSIERLAFVNP